MKLGTNQPMGPLALADLIGLDTCLAILEVFLRETGDTKYRACPLSRKLAGQARAEVIADHTSRRLGGQIGEKMKDRLG